MSLYFLEWLGQGDSKKYRFIYVGSLWAEQFEIKIDQFFSPVFKFSIFMDFQIFDKMDQFQSQIARLTDIPQKWACTFWNCEGKAFPSSIVPFLWVVYELSNSRSNIAWFCDGFPRDT